MDKKLLHIIKNSFQLVDKRNLELPIWAYLVNFLDVRTPEAYKLCKEFGFDPKLKAKTIMNDE